MTDPETTLPPKQPLWKRALTRAYALVCAYPDRALFFLLGFGACGLLWWLW